MASRRLRSVFTRRPVVISSPLTGEEVADRLDAVTYSWSAAIWYSLDSRRHTVDRRRLYGRVSAKRLRVARFRGWRIHNSWVPFLSARTRTTPLGTVIEGKVGVHPWVLAFEYVWFAGLAFLSFGAVAHVARQWGEAGARSLAVLLGPLALGAFGAALTRFGQRLTHGDDVWLIDYVTELLGAEVFDPR